MVFHIKVQKSPLDRLLSMTPHFDAVKKQAGDDGDGDGDDGDDDGKGGFGGEGFDDDMEVREACDHDHDYSYDGQGDHDLPWWSKWPGEMGGDCQCDCDQDDEFVTIVLSSQNPISSANHVR